MKQRRSASERRDAPTVEQSRGVLREPLGKASDDMRAKRVTLDRPPADIATCKTCKTSMSRTLVKDAERVIGQLRQSDEYVCRASMIAASVVPGEERVTTRHA